MASLIKRGSFYFIQFDVGGKLRRVATRTSVYQIAKEQLRKFESGQYRGVDNPLPSRTSIVSTSRLNFMSDAAIAKASFASRNAPRTASLN